MGWCGCISYFLSKFFICFAPKIGEMFRVDYFSNGLKPPTIPGLSACSLEWMGLPCGIFLQLVECMEQTVTNRIDIDVPPLNKSSDARGRL